MCTGGASQIARDTARRGHGKNVPTRGKDSSLSFGRDAETANTSTAVAMAGPRFREIVAKAHGNLFDLFGRPIQLVDVSAVFKYDRFVAQRRKLAIEIGKLRNLSYILRFQVIRPDIEPNVLIAIREKV